LGACSYLQEEIVLSQVLRIIRLLFPIITFVESVFAFVERDGTEGSVVLLRIITYAVSIETL
jgi:hypothetical protein